jgi:hypothetical protein
MAHAIWGIATGLVLIFAASLRIRMRERLRNREVRWLDANHVLDRLRKRYGLQAEK